MYRRAGSLSLFILLIVVVAPSFIGCNAGNPTSPGVPLPPPAPAPAPVGTFVVVGTVSELVGTVRIPVPGVQVHDEVRHVSVTTATDGSYVMNGVEPYEGNAYLSFSKAGYNTTRELFALTEVHNRIDVQLQRQ